ncbi:SGNH/GDSL hydrolase family protein [Amycolatopsis saalfeldensis]|uniref:GDSL-like Lipase/Acylhydrolase family protein n=1 Tax=Amycolatopsis saalfeldensis TaxID=394193 RepID=A0A1H8XJD5_9PSEU|nr:SGNH/GDSL hydrolase family protein [Amycolatopsis saalfeldensis]SEP39358.1 GDSL-like Lipase/Acylhydrolase family protein [Amycolatopsis saalfeldensis]
MTHHLALPDNRVTILGALDLERTPNGVRPRRLPAWTRPRLPDDLMDLVVSQAAGVRLRLRTAARSLALGVHVTVPVMPEGLLPASFDLTVGGTVLARVPATAGDVLHLAESRLSPGPAETVRFDGLPAGEKDVEIWLPHSATVELRTLDADAPLLTPTPPPGAAWVHYGSSISHGLEAPAPTLVWPAVAALATGTALTNLGFAGSAMLDPEVARAIRDTPAGLVTLKAGINLVGEASMRERTFVPAVHGFLDMIRDGHPRTPIVLVSPTSFAGLETTSGPVTLDPETGRKRALGSAGAGALTLSGVRALLAKIVGVREDPALRYLDGRELLGPDEAAALPDGLHPDPAAHLRMGERAARLLVAPQL